MLRNHTFHSGRFSPTDTIIDHFSQDMRDLFSMLLQPQVWRMTNCRLSPCIGQSSRAPNTSTVSSRSITSTAPKQSIIHLHAYTASASPVKLSGSWAFSTMYKLAAPRGAPALRSQFRPLARASDTFRPTTIALASRQRRGYASEAGMEPPSFIMRQTILTLKRRKGPRHHRRWCCGICRSYQSWPSWPQSTS